MFGPGWMSNFVLVCTIAVRKPRPLLPCFEKCACSKPETTAVLAVARSCLSRILTFAVRTIPPLTDSGVRVNLITPSPPIGNLHRAINVSRLCGYGITGGCTYTKYSIVCRAGEPVIVAEDITSIWFCPADAPLTTQLPQPLLVNVHRRETLPGRVHHGNVGAHILRSLL